MCKDLMNQSQHLQRVVDHFTNEQIANNRLQLKASIFIVKYLAFQAIAFRGRVESFSLLNRGNFLESLGIVTFWNKKVAEIIEKAPKNATYTSPRIQKEILHVFSGKVKKTIREEIGDAKFCIMVDEAHDKSMREQMAMVFRYVDIYKIFESMDMMEQATCKRNEQLKVTNANEIARLIDLEELETRSGLNQIVLQNIIDDAIDGEHRAEAESAYDGLTSFEFVFILHLEKETMEITNKLCQALQSQSQDILNVRHLVSSTKALIQKFRDNGWDDLLTTLISFCEKHCINVPDMNARYVTRQGRARNQQDNVTIDHHYRVNIFHVAIDSQLQELNHQFNENTMELLRLSSNLEPRETLKSFRISTATTKRAFLAIKVVKTNLRSKMENDFLTDSSMLYIENDITSTFSLNLIINDFEDLKKRRIPFS
ncbi:uncharacterized protein LOC142640304 [Castanea sativa]|uniref:uncharacterized protein LOC142640304 n=1 Tax=Castanea sativa TaxID=21020 RepID=UPI003F6516CD